MLDLTAAVQAKPLYLQDPNRCLCEYIHKTCNERQLTLMLVKSILTDAPRHGEPRRGNYCYTVATFSRLSKFIIFVILSMSNLVSNIF